MHNLLGKGTGESVEGWGKLVTYGRKSARIKRTEKSSNDDDFRVTTV